MRTNPDYYNCVSVTLSGTRAGMIRYMWGNRHVTSESGGIVHEDADGIHILLPDRGRRPAEPPGGARLPDPLEMTRSSIRASDFRSDLVRQIALAVDENEPVLDEVSELFGTQRGTLHMHRRNNGKYCDSFVPTWHANFFGDCPEADSFLTWLASYMCNFRLPFRAGERLEGHKLLPEVLGQRQWSDKLTPWSSLMKQAVWIYMEFRKSLLPVQQRVE